MTNILTPLDHLQSSQSSFSSLPDDIVVRILARIPRSYYGSLYLVSRSFYSLVSSPEMYAVRYQIGATKPCLYVCLWSPTSPKDHRWYTIVNRFEDQLSLVPVSLSSSYTPARLRSTTVTVGFEIYQIGGTVGNRRSKAVRVLDCRNHVWRRAPGLRVARICAKSCFLDGKIYVIGGGAEEESSKNWGEVFDLKIQTWKPLPSPNGKDELDPSHQVVVFGSVIYVITKHNKYAYDPKEGRWLEPDDAVLRKPPIVRGPSCVIENVMFAERGGNYEWYDSMCGVWLMVENLGIVYANHGDEYLTIHLVNHGGKLVIIWHERVDSLLCERRGVGRQDRRVFKFAVIRLTFMGTKIWGEVEHCDVVVRSVTKPWKVLTCLSVSL